MSIGLRCRHDRSVRELAAGMFGEGRGYKSVAGSCIQSSKSRQFALSISHTSLGACPNP